MFSVASLKDVHAAPQKNQHFEHIMSHHIANNTKKQHSKEQPQKTTNNITTTKNKQHQQTTNNKQEQTTPNNGQQQSLAVLSCSAYVLCYISKAPRQNSENHKQKQNHNV